MMRPAQWRKLLVNTQEDELVELIRKRTFTGRALGSDRFIAKLEAKLNRRLRANRVGRPAKKNHKAPTKRKNTTHRTR